MRTIAVATRALEPTGGGAERSLRSLLRWSANPEPQTRLFKPFSTTSTLWKNKSQYLEPWIVSTCFAMNGERPTGLLGREIQAHIINASTESIFSGLAWRLRSRRSWTIPSAVIRIPSS